MSDGKIVPFGKYKGQPLEVMAQDQQYVEWLTAQPWFREKFAPIYNVIINNYGEPSETPEHNAMQALFLEDEYVVALALASGHFKAAADSILKVVKASPELVASLLQRVPRREAEYQDSFYDKSRSELLATLRAVADAAQRLTQEIPAWLMAPTFQVHELRAAFEVDGADVSCSFRVGSMVIVSQDDYEALRQTYTTLHEDWSFRGWAESVFFRAELKPAMGDDYPAVLRQMTKHNTNVLVVGEFDARGASLEQCTEFFRRSRVALVTMAEVRGCLADARQICRNGKDQAKG